MPFPVLTPCGVEHIQLTSGRMGPLVCIFLAYVDKTGSFPIKWVKIWAGHALRTNRSWTAKRKTVHPYYSSIVLIQFGRNSPMEYIDVEELGCDSLASKPADKKLPIPLFGPWSPMVWRISFVKFVFVCWPEYLTVNERPVFNWPA